MVQRIDLPAPPGYDEVRVDLPKEVLSSGMPAAEASDGRVIIGLLLQLRLLRVRPRHADVLGQEVNEHLPI